MGLLVTDFVDYFSEITDINKKEVERIATTVREILDIDNIINNAKKQEAYKIVVSLLDILDDETISKKTDVPIEEVVKLRKQH